MNYESTLMWKELNETPDIVSGLYQRNATVLERICAAVGSKAIASIYTVARGTSDHAMLYLKYLCETELGIPVASGAPSVVTLYGGAMRLENALVIGCSQSGKAADVLEVIRAANACGGITVSITNDESSPLAQTAQYHLYCDAGEEKSVAATKTFCSQLYLSMLLVSALKGERCDRQIGSMLKRARASLERAAFSLAERFVDAKECFLLARGVSSAIAFECGLKLQETCYIRARAFHSSDFYHGPMAMIESGTKVIVFSSKHSLAGGSDELRREDDRKCAKKMRDLGADLYIITDQAEAFQDIGATVLSIEGGKTEAETVFAFAMTIQMFACKVSCAKGLNPDVPRALNKVTITR